MKTTQLTDNQTITDQTDSIIWYAWNYHYDFIDRCWGHDKCLANHLKDKFQACIQNDRRNGFFTFISQLDSYNRTLIYDFILETFSRETGHK